MNIDIDMRVLAFAWERNLKVNPSLYIVDFKTANMSASQLLLPNAQVKECLFHFSQSLVKTILHESNMSI